MEQFSKRTGISVFLMIVLIVLAIILTGGGAWYYMDGKASDEKAVLQTQIDDLNAKIDDLNSASPAATTDTSAAADSAPQAAATDSNVALVTSRAQAFEDLNGLANAKSEELLAYFTPASTSVENDFYDFLTGADAAAPRLKATATFSYSFASYKVNSVDKSGSKYIARITENRQVAASNGSSNQVAKPQSKIIEFILSGGIYKIDKYYTEGVTGDIPSTTGGDATPQKYEGFYTN